MAVFLSTNPVKRRLRLYLLKKSRAKKFSIKMFSFIISIYTMLRHYSSLCYSILDICSDSESCFGESIVELIKWSADHPAYD